MKIKIKAPDFLREEAIFFVEQRLERGRVLYTLPWESSSQVKRMNKRFRELTRKTRMTEEEKRELIQIVRKGWKQYVTLYHIGITYAMCLKFFQCKVISSLWGKDPKAIYFEMKREESPLDFVSI